MWTGPLSQILRALVFLVVPCSAVVKCPPFPPQTHRRNTCHGPSYYGDECTFSCDTGYTLVGRPVVTCNVEGNYDGMAPNCEIKACPAPPLPEGGASWSCNNGFNYDSVCTIHCAPGNRNVRTYDRSPFEQSGIRCQADQTWTRMPHCTETCHEPKLPIGGQRWNCFNGHNKGSVCWIQCSEGFRNVGDITSITCQAGLSWTEKPVCTDVSAPTIINCPGNIQTQADKGKRSTRVNWDDIRATDNSDQVFVILVKGRPSGSIFTEGAHEVSYEAVDNAGLKDTCTFHVNVEVLQCLVPLMDDDKVEHDCENGYLYGFSCSLSCPYGYTLQGASSMSCEREGGNMTWKYLGPEPTCVPKECPEPPLPLGGKGWQCSNAFTFNSECIPECRHGYIPARTRTVDGAGWRDSYLTCAGDGSWIGIVECIADVWEIMQAIADLKQDVKTLQRTFGQLLNNTSGNKTP